MTIGSNATSSELKTFPAVFEQMINDDSYEILNLGAPDATIRYDTPTSWLK